MYGAQDLPPPGLTQSQAPCGQGVPISYARCRSDNRKTEMPTAAAPYIRVRSSD